MGNGCIEMNNKPEDLYIDLALNSDTELGYGWWTLYYHFSDNGECRSSYTMRLENEDIPAIIETMQELQAQNQAAIEALKV